MTLHLSDIRFSQSQNTSSPSALYLFLT